MMDNKDVTLSIPASLLKEAEELEINLEETLISSLNRQIILKRETEKLKQGYIEMGEINLGLAELSLEAENEALAKAEHYLTECE